MQITQSRVFPHLNVVPYVIKRYIHKIQSVKVFVLKSQFLNRYTSKASELMNMYGNVFFHARIQWKMSNSVWCVESKFTFNMSAASQRLYTYLHVCTWKYFTKQFIYRILKNLWITTDQLEISCLVSAHYSPFISLYRALVVETMPKGYDLARIWAAKCRKSHHPGFRNPSVLLMQIILQYWKNWLLWTSLYDYHRSCLISILGWLSEHFSVGKSPVDLFPKAGSVFVLNLRLVSYSHIYSPSPAVHSGLVGFYLSFLRKIHLAWKIIKHSGEWNKWIRMSV